MPTIFVERVPGAAEGQAEGQVQGEPQLTADAAALLLLAPLALAAQRLQAGEKREIQHSLQALLGGTFTVSAATFQLRRGGQPVAGWEIPATVSGFDGATSSLAKVWHLLDTSALAVGFYSGVFTVSITETGQIVELGVLIRVAP